MHRRAVRQRRAPGRHRALRRAFGMEEMYARDEKFRAAIAHVFTLNNRTVAAAF